MLTTKSLRHVTDQAPRPVDHLTFEDGILAALLVGNLILQFFADQQQWEYQNFKRGKDASEKPLTIDSPRPYTESDAARGFVTRGLWAYSRHPNFACEQTTW
jgi:steroid 5-alpha reductase family enzyme